uniref:SSD domain-containing protein n=1 Tax=Heterorhabditis bacteriophora TaxID=37862 RepID=A0A1I7XPK5_HETBA
MKILPSELPNAMNLEKLPQPEPTRLIRYIMRFYRSWAYFVADHAVLMISVCTVLTLFGTVKVITTPNENDITGYTPYGARARDELEVASEFFSRGGSGIAVFVLILPKNGGNALNKDVLEEALRFFSWPNYFEFALKLSLAIMACVCPFMACCTALGALFFGGVRFGSILCVTPFLVLAIGVDDAYLMIHSWQRVTRKLQTTPVKEDSSGYRLAEVLSDTGPAIMISALTNILADTVGTYTGSPEITLLAYGNMACIFVDFIYQVN